MARGRMHQGQDHSLSRRDFAFVLATGAQAIIVGHFLGGGLARASGPGDSETRPRLRVPVGPTGSDGMTTLMLGEGSDRSVCAVNRTGAEIVRLLDGTRSVEQVAARTSRNLRLRRDQAFDAKIACFVAELAQMGFLAAPFYVEIVEHTTSL